MKTAAPQYISASGTALEIGQEVAHATSPHERLGKIYKLFPSGKAGVEWGCGHKQPYNPGNLVVFDRGQK